MKQPVPCKTCGKPRMIDDKKQTAEQYLAVSPNCRKCATKDPELRARISKGWFKKGQVSTMKGKTHSLETRKKLSLAAKGQRRSPATEFKKGQTSREKNINWKGGITPENMKIRQSQEYKDWRTAVFKRDDYTCQECKSRGYKLHADHIKPFAYFPELRLVIENGRTLCVDCHRKTPTYSLGARKIYGKNA